MKKLIQEEKSTEPHRNKKNLNSALENLVKVSFLF
jgi:hypothetical protein